MLEPDILLQLFWVSHEGASTKGLRGMCCCFVLSQSSVQDSSRGHTDLCDNDVI